jgi:hypothetical protein
VEKIGKTVDLIIAIIKDAILHTVLSAMAIEISEVVSKETLEKRGLSVHALF